jgi:hypothetical protein
VDVISRIALIYVTVLFMGVVGMVCLQSFAPPPPLLLLTPPPHRISPHSLHFLLLSAPQISVQPVLFAERPAFYREQYSEIYDVKLYTLAATLVEVGAVCWCGVL